MTTPINTGDLVRCRADALLYLSGAFQVVEVRPNRIKLRFDDHDEWRPARGWIKIEDDTPHRARMVLDGMDVALDYARHQNVGELYSEILPDGRLVVTDAEHREWIVTAIPRPADD